MKRYTFGRLSMVLLLCLVIVPSISAETLESPHFVIIYQPSDSSLARAIAGSIERARETLTEELGVGHENLLKIKFVSFLPSTCKARYLPDRTTMEVLTKEAMTRSFGGECPPFRFVEGILWHEYIHFLQHRAMKRFIKDQNALWFIEGTAEYLGRLRFVKPYSPEVVWKEGQAILSRGRLPTLEDLNRYHSTNQYPLGTYFFSADAVAFLTDKCGIDSLGQITKCRGNGKELPECLYQSLGIDLKTFEREWHDNLEKRYRCYIRNS